MAELARARKQAEQMVLLADAELERSRKAAEQTVVTARAEAEQSQLAGQGEAARLTQIGLAEAATLLRKVQSLGDPRLYALTLVVAQLAQSKQPLVPERVFLAGANGQTSPGDAGAPHAATAQGLLGLLLSLLVAEKSGFSPDGTGSDRAPASLEEYADKLTREAIEEPPAAAGA